MDELQRKKAMRLRVLHAFYEKSGGDIRAHLVTKDIFDELGFDLNELPPVVQYLQGEGLIKVVSMQGLVLITHAGIVEVEQAIEQPSKPTAHFPPGVLSVSIGSVSGSQLQIGTHNSHQTMTSQQTVEFEKILQVFLEAVRASNASAEQKELAEARVDLVLSEMKVPADKRDTSKLARAWDHLKNLNTVLSLGKALWAGEQFIQTLLHSHHIL